MSDHQRLSDRILEAHRLACRERRREIAEILLKALEAELSQLGKFEGEHRRSMEMLEAAFVLHRETFPDSHL
jgi:hypothetical protein